MRNSDGLTNIHVSYHKLWPLLYGQFPLRSLTPIGFTRSGHRNIWLDMIGDNMLELPGNRPT
jgi:hypothetical protein